MSVQPAENNNERVRLAATLERRGDRAAVSVHVRACVGARARLQCLAPQQKMNRELCMSACICLLMRGHA
jgi:hypothetical protein